MLTGDKNLDFKILNQLDDKSLVNYCTTDKKANQICNSQIFWMNRILTKFPYLDIRLLNKILILFNLYYLSFAQNAFK